MEPARINSFDVWDECRKNYLIKLNERKTELIEKFGEYKQQEKVKMGKLKIIIFIKKMTEMKSAKLENEKPESKLNESMPNSFALSKMDSRVIKK